MRKSFKNLSKFIMSFLVVVLFSGFVACGDKKQDVAKEPELKPLTGLMWEVTKGDKKGYLIGTIHIYNKEYSYTNETVDKIIKESDGLAVEVDITDPSEITLVTKAVMAEEGKTIEDLLSPEELQKFKNTCTDLGIVYEPLKMFNGYGISSMMETTILKQAGLTEQGYDQYLLEKFKADKKEVVGIEGAAFQIDMLKKMYDDDYIKKLPETYTDAYIKESTSSSKAMYDAFVKGDADYFDGLARIQKITSKEEYDLVLKDRNVGMAKKAEELIDSGKVYTIAVGSLHYAGDDSVIKLLEADGYTVKQLK